MRSLYFLLALVISASMITPNTNLIFGQGMQSTTITSEQSQPNVELTGHQFYPNGTGMKYFSDNSSRPFTHVMTPDKGCYYDNSTNYTIGFVLRVSESRNATMEKIPLTEGVINITIPAGAALLPKAEIPA